MSELAADLHDAEADYSKAEQEAIVCSHTHDNLMAAMTQVAVP